MRRLLASLASVVPLVWLVACAAAEREADDAAVAPPPPDAAAADALELVDAQVVEPPPDAAIDAAPDASLVVCGDGVREGSEQCDDGNAIQTDGCLGCLWARCGDGNVRTGVEECDDGNPANGDSCNAVCMTCSGGDGRFTWPVNNHCYTRFAAVTSWDAAQDVCANARAHLATLSSDLENGAVTAGVLSGTGNHWIGSSDQAVEGTLAWVTNEPTAGYSHFQQGEPNNDGNEDCIETSNVGLWNDDKCGSTNPVLCEDDGWFVRTLDNHAYRVVYRPVTWSAALAGCASLSGHLVTLTTAEENAFVSAHAFGNLWGGATDASTEGTFTWVTGEPYVFTAYQASEPNNSGATGEDCLELTMGLGWNDLACTELRGYVCEVD